MLKLKLHYFGHLMRRTDSLEKTLILGRLKARAGKGSRRWDGLIASPVQWTWIWAGSRRQRETVKPGMLQSMRLQRVRHDLVTEQQQIFWNGITVFDFTRSCWMAVLSGGFTDIPPSNGWASRLPHILVHSLASVFSFSCLDRCVAMSHGDLILHFSYD